MRRVLCAALLLLVATPAAAQRSSGDRGPGEATPIRCVNIAGTAFEACGGGGGVGSTVAIDQTTPGTTNGVVVNSSALPTGAATEATLSSLNGKLPATSTPANGESNAVSLSRLGSFNYIFNGSTWDRWTGAVTLASTTITGTVATAEVLPATVLHNKTVVTTAGTRVVLAGSTTAKSVTIKALITNTGTIYVGSSTVSSANGFQLLPGDSVSLNITNLTTVNLDASVSGEGVTYLAVN